MNDLISRKMAINEFKPYAEYESNRTNKEWVRRIETILNNLPPAQPEIIRCKDCKHYNAGFECLIEGYGIERSADWYCGDAERRPDE